MGIELYIVNSELVWNVFKLSIQDSAHESKP